MLGRGYLRGLKTVEAMRVGMRVGAVGCRRVHEVAAEGFNVNMETYEAARPSYPGEIVEGVVSALGGTPGGKSGEGVSVVEVGAGTGKFTRLLLEESATSGLDLDLLAVEPAQGMIDVFEQAMGDHMDKGNLRIAAGSADALPVEGGSVDGIVVAQAFHWFANDEVVAEFARALRTDGGGEKGGKGVLALVWNMEDRSAGWVDQLRTAYEAYEGDAPQYRHGTWREVFDHPGRAGGDLFAPLDSRIVSYAVPATLDVILGRAMSKSYINRLDQDKQDAVREHLERIALDAHPHLSDPAATVDYPYTTELVLTTPL